jgi:tetratricopeptide (TPR) repeat protein
LIDPTFVPALNNLGLALKAKGRLDEAVAEYHDALRINPESAPVHFNLADILAGRGELSEAINHYQQVLRIDPDFARAHYQIGIALVAKGWWDEVDEFYPAGVHAFDQIRGQAHRDALTHYLQAFFLNPKWTPARNRLKISHQDLARLNEAIGHYQEAIRLEPRLDLAHGALGQALLAQRHFGEAEAATRRSLDLLQPVHNQFRANLEDQLNRCGHLFVLESRLPAIVEAKEKPAPADLLAAAELCYVKKHYATAAHLYGDAISVTPQLAEDLRAGHRFNAACAAALAGCKCGGDVAALSEPERASLRQRARDWLRLDLSAWEKELNTGTVGDIVQAHKALSQWRSDSDLAVLRDTNALERLPPDESQKCRALWNDVDLLFQASADPSSAER